MTIISNDEIHDFIKIIKSLEDSGLLIKRVTETVQNEAKKQKWISQWNFFLIISTLGASLLGDLFIGKEVYRTGKGKGKGIKKTGEGVLRAGYGNNNSKIGF